MGPDNWDRLADRAPTDPGTSRRPADLAPTAPDTRFRPAAGLPAAPGIPRRRAPGLPAAPGIPRRRAPGLPAAPGTPRRRAAAPGAPGCPRRPAAPTAAEVPTAREPPTAACRARRTRPPWTRRHAGRPATDRCRPAVPRPGRAPASAGRRHPDRARCRHKGGGMQIPDAGPAPICCSLRELPLTLRWRRGPTEITPSCGKIRMPRYQVGRSRQEPAARARHDNAAPQHRAAREAPGNGRNGALLRIQQRRWHFTAVREPRRWLFTAVTAALPTACRLPASRATDRAVTERAPN